ncbi:anaphase-promoting complex subunit 11 RING-H2 finger protein [Medicago truncatula]|uniref:Anaphase-promoting complex subunit 11 RING-H2 finger protein n=1 Tax=Medicago truncatula TaxID=3880 RepID=A0A072VGG3_MEDTR|nr:anaphase-promoting complex subunit 11 RING-H2 finger protein [Medicago truncatula]
MSSSNEPYFINIEESSDTIPQFFYPHECFLIKRHYFHSPSFNHYSFIIPRNILCDYDDLESVDPGSLSNTLLRNALSVLPDEALEDALFLMGDNAKHMSRVNFEGDRILKMDVLVGQKGSSTILEKVELNDIATSSSMKECAICLEEFCCGSEEEHIVRTKCMHVFHEHCVTNWIMHCDITNPQYPCPMCRSQIQ